MAAFLLHGQRRIVATDKAWAAKPKIFTNYDSVCVCVLVEGRAVSDNLGLVGPLQEQMREGVKSQVVAASCVARLAPSGCPRRAHK